MRWETFLSTTAIMAAIAAYEWPRMKKHPKKDKASFVVLLSAGWILAQFDLQNMAGPVTILKAMFEPFSKMLNME
jgi:hypothetical protein